MAKRGVRAAPTTGAAAVERIRRLTRAAGAGAVTELQRLGREAESESVRLAALKELLDRGVGRAASAPSGSDGGPVAHLLVDDGYAD